jgi:hypothetical protein
MTDMLLTLPVFSPEIQKSFLQQQQMHRHLSLLT